MSPTAPLDMLREEQLKALEELRKPFPADVVGVLPKPYSKDSPKGDCRQCGGYHGLPAAHLKYVGHAAVTNRLLMVDPLWNWTPLAFDEHGLPKVDPKGNLWIQLTVAGMTRLGVGDGFSMKEMIGDAIRNASMRFGVALELWAKDALEDHDGTPMVQAPPPPPVDPEQVRLRGRMFQLAKDRFKDPNEFKDWLLAGKFLTPDGPTSNELGVQAMAEINALLEAVEPPPVADVSEPWASQEPASDDNPPF